MKEYVSVDDAIGDLPTLNPGESSDVPNHKAPQATDSVKERIATTNPGDTLYESYETNRRLEFDSPSPTIIGKDWKYAHYEQCRGISVRERARLQTFPDDVEFEGGMTEQRQQVANAVPVKLAESIAESISSD